MNQQNTRRELRGYHSIEECMERTVLNVLTNHDVQVPELYADMGSVYERVGIYKDGSGLFVCPLTPDEVYDIIEQEKFSDLVLQVRPVGPEVDGPRRYELPRRLKATVHKPGVEEPEFTMEFDDSTPLYEIHEEVSAQYPGRTLEMIFVEGE